MIPPEKEPVKKFTGKKALLWFVGFFLVVFAVNGIMVYIALGTWGGLETQDAYRKGLHFNDKIAAAEEQRQSGWDIKIGHTPQQQQGDRIDIAVRWPEQDLPPAQVIARITRSVTDAYDQDVTLTRSEGNLFTGPVTLPEAGQWNLNILVIRPDGLTYQVKDKFFIPGEK